jgi:S-DNA-T family DNA segregation ATPase FtsK/SpoIIIE
MLGPAGAYLADGLLQLFGLASVIIALFFIRWGWRVIRTHAPPPVIWPSALLFIGMMLATAGLARLPVTDTLSTSYAGGAIGAILLTQLGGILQPIFGPWAMLGTSVILGIISLPFLSLAFGYRWAHWRFAMDYAVYYTQLVKAGLATVYDFLSRQESKAQKPAKPKRPRRKKRVAEPESPHRLEKGSREAKEKQPKLRLSDSGDFELPPLTLLQEPPNNTQRGLSEEELEKNAQLLEQVLEDFGIEGEIVQVNPGPVVTQYELRPAPGTKSSRIISLSDDIARSMSAVSCRVAVIRGRNVIGIELPNQKRDTVYLREILASKAFENTKHRLGLALGKTIAGDPVLADLSRMPHLMVAGTTGSGKSVGINAMILSLMYQHSPEKCKFILVDPKMLELSVYDGIPNLLTGVVTDPKEAVTALQWAVREMEDRYKAMAKLGVRNIDGYNARLAKARKKGEVLTRKVQTGFDSETGKPVYEEEAIDLVDLPHIVVVVDEFADLMLVSGKDVETSIQRLAQMARAAGIHLIMATQRPSVDVITGTVKANFPTRISYQVTSKIDSRTILGEGGAEYLLGKGDMLYMAGGGRLTRVHGPFVTDQEVEAVVAHLKSQGEADYIEDITDSGSDSDGLFTDADSGEDVDEKFDEAVALVAREQRASTSFLQRHLRIGYNRAARIIDFMEAEDMISAADHVGRREVHLRKSDG